MTASERFIYKICSAELWLQAEEEGVFRGAEIDLGRRFYPFLGGRTGQGNGGKAFCRAGRAGAGLCGNRRAGAGLGAIKGWALFRISMALGLEQVVWVRLKAAG